MRRWYVEKRHDKKSMPAGPCRMAQCDSPNNSKCRLLPHFFRVMMAAPSYRCGEKENQRMTWKNLLMKSAVPHRTQKEKEEAKSGLLLFSWNPIRAVAGGTARYPIGKGMVVDGDNVDGGSGPVDEMNVFKIMAEGALAVGPAEFVFGLVERQAAGGIEQIPIILPFIEGITPATRNNKSKHQNPKPKTNPKSYIPNL